MTFVTVANVRLLRSLAVVGVVWSVLLLCYLGITVANAHPDEATTPDALGSISGVVRDQQGAPLAGIRLAIYRTYFSEPARVVTTTALGEYKAPFLPAGLYRLQATDSSRIYGPIYYPQAATWNGATDVPVAGNQISGIDFTLAPAAYITGTTTILTETAATGGYVTLYTKVDDKVNDFWDSVSSSSITTTGVYTIGPISPGVFRICATTYFGTDFFVGCYGGGITPNAAADLPVAAGETKGNINIPTGVEQFNGAITGTVTANGAPLAGIRVALSLYSGASPLVYGLTDASGSYTLGGLSDGYYYVEFADPAQIYATAYYKDQRSFDRAEGISILESAIVSNVNATLVQSGAISGTIRLNTGQPAAHAQLQLYYRQNRYGYEGWAPFYPINYTDEDGNFTLRSLWPDTYRLCVYGTPFGYSECYGSVSYYSELSDAQDLVVQPGGLISGVNMILGPDALLYLPIIAQ